MSERTCTVDGCGERTGQSGTARGLCSPHYKSWLDTGEPKPEQAACRWCRGPIEKAPLAGSYCSTDCARAAAEVPDATKPCRTCNEDKPYAAFQRKTSAPDGFARVCRTCDSARRIERKVQRGLRRPDPPPGYKWCSRCETDRPLDDFYVRRSGPQKGKPHAHCRDCLKADNTARARSRGVQPKKPADPYAVKRARLRGFHLTLDDYWALLDKQGRRCPGCYLHWDDAEQWFSVDHDHWCCPGTQSCGKCVRGLLCAGCNFAAGHCRDDPRVLRRLARYLETTAQHPLFRTVS